MNLEQLKKIIKKYDIETITLLLRGVTSQGIHVSFPSSALEELLASGWIINSKEICEQYNNAEWLTLRPDLNSCIEDFPNRRLLFIADAFKGDDLTKKSPREVLKNSLLEAEKLGYEYVVSAELSFRVQSKESSSDQQFIDSVINYLDAILYPYQSIRTYNANIFAVELRNSDALAIADQLHMLTFILKELAQKNRSVISFMPKSKIDAPGNYLAISQILRSKDGGSAIYNESQNQGLSRVGQNVVAGQLTHAKALMAFLASTVNSYKRLLLEKHSLLASWDEADNAALIQVPKSRDGITVQIRSADAFSNQYLLFAALLAAAIDGMKRNILPQKTEKENGSTAQESRRLPQDLGASLYELEINRVIQKALGPEIVEVYINSKRLEWKLYTDHISDWEQRYYA